MNTKIGLSLFFAGLMLTSHAVASLPLALSAPALAQTSVKKATQKSKESKKKKGRKAKGKKDKTADNEQAPSTFPTTLAGLTYAPTTKTDKIVVRRHCFGTYNSMRFHSTSRPPHLSPHEAHMHARENEFYIHLHPTLRAWIERAYRETPDNLIYCGYYEGKQPAYLLYKSELLQKNGTSGCSLRFGAGEFECDLLGLGRAESAWTHTKEPAVNPHTGRPWIGLTPTEQKKVERLGTPLSDQDALFLQGVQNIINENFHYFYGMAYVRPEEQGISNEQLFAKILPTKVLLFGKRAIHLCGDHATPLQQRLYAALGHPLYSYKIYPTPHAWSMPLCLTGNLTSKGSAAYVDGLDYDYFLNPCFNQPSLFTSLDTTFFEKENLFIKYSNFYTTHGQYCFFCFPEMLRGLRKLCEEQGGNADTESANTTALSLSLYYLYKRTELYCNTIILHFYTHLLKNSRNNINLGSSPSIPRHYKRMSDEIALPGVPGTGRHIRAKKHNDE